MKKLIIIISILFLVSGCIPMVNTELDKLQTQVVKLSSGQEEGSKLSDDELPKGLTIPALTDEERFTLLFVDTLNEKGWVAGDVEDDSFILTTSRDGVYLIEYVYESSQISRVMIYSIWIGVGGSNLRSEVLSDINRINDEQYIAKVSIDSDGDVWLETVLAFEGELDVDFFCRYVEWFEDSEMLLILGDLGDYIAEDESMSSGEV